MPIPSEPLPHPDAPPRRRLVMLAQGIGAIVCIGLLGWVITRAGAQMTPERWALLRAAPWWQPGLLFALGLFSVAVNGLAWWVALRPVQRIRLADVVAVNAIATALAYLPFKLSVVFRVLYHRTMDGISLLRFGGWAAAVAGPMAAAMIPALLLAPSPLRRQPVVFIMVATFAAFASGLALARLSAFFATGAGWRHWRRLVARLAGRRGIKLLKGNIVNNLRDALHLLARPRTVCLGVAARFLDGASLAARFLIAGELLGTPVDPGNAAIAGICFFALGVVAPTGTLGIREGGAAGVLAILGVNDVAPVIVIVSATQILADLIAATVGTMVLGSTKLSALRARARAGDPTLR